jgi:hypothetical protein
MGAIDERRRQMVQGLRQVSRLAIPLSMSDHRHRFKDLEQPDPEDEKRFIDFYQNPRLAFLLNASSALRSLPPAQRLGYVVPAYFAPVFSGPRDLSDTLACEPRHTADAACGLKALDRAEQCGGCDFRLRLRFQSNSIRTSRLAQRRRRTTTSPTSLSVRSRGAARSGPLSRRWRELQSSAPGTPDVSPGITSLPSFLSSDANLDEASGAVAAGPTNHCSVNRVKGGTGDLPVAVLRKENPHVISKASAC